MLVRRGLVRERLRYPVTIDRNGGMPVMKASRMHILLSVVALSVACGGGGGGGGGAVPGPGPGPSTIVAGFQSDQPTPGAQSVSMSQGGVNGDTVTVRVNVTDATGVYGAAFEVGFDPARAFFLGHAPGNLLEQNGASVNYNVQEAPAGTIVIGASRTGNVAGANVAGTRTLVNLTFRLRQAGSWPLTTANASLLDSQVQAIAGISWSAGTLEGI